MKKNRLIIEWDIVWRSSTGWISDGGESSDGGGNVAGRRDALAGDADDDERSHAGRRGAAKQPAGQHSFHKHSAQDPQQKRQRHA